MTKKMLRTVFSCFDSLEGPNPIFATPYIFSILRILLLFLSELCRSSVGVLSE